MELRTEPAQAPDSMSAWVSVAVIAKQTGVSSRTVNRWRKEPSFPAGSQPSPGIVRFRWDDVERWIASRPIAGCEEPASVSAARAAKAAGQAPAPAPFNGVMA